MSSAASCGPTAGPSRRCASACAGATPPSAASGCSAWRGRPVGRLFLAFLLSTWLEGLGGFTHYRSRGADRLPALRPVPRPGRAARPEAAAAVAGADLEGAISQGRGRRNTARRRGDVRRGGGARAGRRCRRPGMLSGPRPVAAGRQQGRRRRQGRRRPRKRGWSRARAGTRCARLQSDFLTASDATDPSRSASGARSRAAS
jgi:hypothetical protein